MTTLLANLLSQIMTLDPDFSGLAYDSLEDFIGSGKSVPFDVHAVRQEAVGTLVEVYDGDTSYTVLLQGQYDEVTLQAANVDSLTKVLERRYALHNDTEALTPIINAAYPGKFKGRLFEALAAADMLLGSFWEVRNVWFEFGYTLVFLDDIRKHLRDSHIIAFRGQYTEEQVRSILKPKKFKLTH